MEKLLSILIENKHITVVDYKKFDNFIIFNNDFFFREGLNNFIEIYIFYSFNKNIKNSLTINLVKYIECLVNKGLISKITFVTPFGNITEDVSYESFSPNIKKNLKKKNLILLTLKK